MVFPEQKEQNFEGQLKVKFFLSLPIGVVFGLSTICIIIEMKWVPVMPLQLEFDYSLSRSIKERLKRQCSKTIFILY